MSTLTIAKHHHIHLCPLYRITWHNRCYFWESSYQGHRDTLGNDISHGVSISQELCTSEGVRNSGSDGFHGEGNSENCSSPSGNGYAMSEVDARAGPFEGEEGWSLEERGGRIEQRG
jgi:hypothetical protein